MYKKKISPRRIIKFALLAILVVLSSVSVVQDARSAPLNKPNLLPLGPEKQLSQATDPECVRDWPAVAYNFRHQEFMVVWDNSWDDGRRDIYARRIANDGTLLTTFIVSTGANKRLRPSLAYNATNDEYLVTWMYDAAGNGIHYEIWGRFIAWDGSYLKPDFQIMSGTERAYYRPEAVWNMEQKEYLVVADVQDTISTQWNDIVYRRVKMDGSLPDVIGQVVQNQVVQPHQSSVSYYQAPDEYMVVWRQWTSGTNWDIYGARLRGSDGSLVNPPGHFIVDNSLADQTNPALGADGLGRYLVVWQHGIGDPRTDWDIYGQKLDESGNRVGNHLVIANSPQVELYPEATISWALKQRVVTWWRATATGDEIWAQAWREPLLGLQYSFKLTTNAAWTISLVAAGPPYLFVYERGDASVSHVYGRIWWPEVTYIPILKRPYRR